MTTHQAIQREDSQNILAIYSWYRLALATIFILMHQFNVANEVLGVINGKLFVLSAFVYFSYGVAQQALIQLKRFHPNQPQLFTLFLSELAILLWFTHLSGGIESGLAYLSLIPLASATILLPAQLAYLLASLVALAALIASLGGVYADKSSTQDTFSAGLLGILLFLAVSLFIYLARRLRDSTVRAEASAAEAADLQRLNEIIVGKMRTGIIVIGNDQRIQLINSAAVQLLGAQLKNKVIAVGQHINNLHGLSKQLERWKTYPWLRTPSFKGSHSSVEIQANFTYLNTEKTGQVLVFLEDIRTLSQHAQQLKLASLGRLTGSIAHEIRNPLGAISHAAQLLEEIDPSEEHEKLTNIIIRHSDRVNNIVNNVLKLSSQNEPEYQKLWLQQWLKRFQGEFTDTHQQGHLDIEHLTDDFQVTFDSLHLSQVITNLTENAIKYSLKKLDKPWVRLVSGTDPSGLPYIKVYDLGDGVPANIRDQIFEPFFTTNHEGSGLGLYLSQELCATNYATISYVDNDGADHYFKVGFAHPEQLLPRNHS